MFSFIRVAVVMVTLHSNRTLTNTEDKTGTQGTCRQEVKKRSWRNDLPGWLSVAYSACFLIFSSKHVIIYVFYVDVCLICMCVCTPEYGIWSHYRWLWAIMWVLVIEFKTTVRLASANYHRGFCPAPLNKLSYRTTDCLPRNNLNNLPWACLCMRA